MRFDEVAVPIAQAEQLVAPWESLCLPAAQSTQFVVPRALW
jgi:hypothetical protein